MIIENKELKVEALAEKIFIAQASQGVLGSTTMHTLLTDDQVVALSESCLSLAQIFYDTVEDRR